ncbi:MAG: 50S ribosomal protein L9 [Actinobacteria bacterium]|nr:50S ribosomal protein L9 [Actinomycetota bacterium]
MKIILASDVDKLGQKGDVLTVADGYARNYLVPKGLAMAATKGTIRQADLMQKVRAERDQRLKEAAAARVAVLASEPVYISARAGEGGRLFGSVTASDVARGIYDQLDQEIDRRDIRLEDPIRALGSFQVEVRLHEEVNALVTVEVIEHEEE